MPERNLAETSIDAVKRALSCAASFDSDVGLRVDSCPRHFRSPCGWGYSVYGSEKSRAFLGDSQHEVDAKFLRLEVSGRLAKLIQPARLEITKGILP